MVPNPIVHIEFSAKNPSEAGKFYSELFGWELQPWPEFNYVTFESKPGPGGGFSEIDGKMYKPGDVIAYIQVDDLEAILKNIESLGGKTLVPRQAIGASSWFAFFADPSGNRVGLFTSNPPA